MKTMPDIPTIGVFDSGFGGLTVLKELLVKVPNARYLYFGDTARLPYGSKSAETVARYAVQAAHFLESHGASLLVLACNTATALAFEQTRAAADIPVVGVVEPGAAAAAAVSRTKKAIVVATEATVSSHAYQRALAARQVQSLEKACPLLVPLVEEGWIDHTVTEQVARIYLDEAFAGDFRQADVLLLGCTHYPLLRGLFQRLVSPGVAIVDSAESTAAAVAQLLQTGTGREGPASPDIRFFATDSAEKFRRLGTRFLGRPVDRVEHVDLKE